MTTLTNKNDNSRVTVDMVALEVEREKSIIWQLEMFDRQAAK